MPFGDVNGFRMHYQVRGQGPLLVMAHGLMGSIANLSALGDVSDLLLTSFQVVNYDARGHGESGWTSDPNDYTWYGLAEDMYGLLCHLGVERAFVGGGSMGAGTSIAFCWAHPEMVEKLVLLSPPPLVEEDMAPVAATFIAFAGLIESAGLERAVEIALSVPPLSQYGESAPAMHEFFRQWLLSQNPQGIVPAIRGVLGGTRLPEDRFKEIRAPCLIVAQPDDPIHPVRSAEILQREIRGSRLVVAPEAMYFALHRDELADVIKGFLSGD